MKNPALVQLVVLLAIGCGRLPANFENLPLDLKIQAYERHFRLGGRNDEGGAWISWHGKPAADLMVPYILGQKRGIPRREAIQIVWDVQLRGCSLAGSEAERALERLSKWLQPFDPDFQLVASTLDSIRQDSHMAGRLDSLPPGPCSRK
jgi:hypothetical protein